MKSRFVRVSLLLSTGLVAYSFGLHNPTKVVSRYLLGKSPTHFVPRTNRTKK